MFGFECPYCRRGLDYGAGLWVCRWCVATWQTANLPNLNCDIPTLVDKIMELGERIEYLEHYSHEHQNDA